MTSSEARGRAASVMAFFALKVMLNGATASTGKSPLVDLGGERVTRQMEAALKGAEPPDDDWAEWRPMVDARCADIVREIVGAGVAVEPRETLAVRMRESDDHRVKDAMASIRSADKGLVNAELTMLADARRREGDRGESRSKGEDAAGRAGANPGRSEREHHGEPELRSLPELDVAVASTADRCVKAATRGAFRSLAEVYSALDTAQRYIASTRGRGPVSLGADIPATDFSPSGRYTMVGGFEPFRNRLNADHEGLFDFEVPAYTWDRPHPAVPPVKANHTFVPSILAEAMRGIAIERNVYLYGPPGCGKTTTTEQIAARLGRPHCLVSFDGAMRKREIVGGHVIVQGQNGSHTKWQDGVMVAALAGPSIIDLDEIDRCDPDLAYVAHQLYERKGIAIFEDGGRRVKPHDHHVLMATANTLGRDDGENAFQLRHEMSEATRDRFAVYIGVDYHDEATERDLLHSDVPTLDRAAVGRLVAMANLIRNAMRLKHITTPCSYRTLLSTALFAQTTSRVEMMRKRREVEAVKAVMVGRMAAGAERMAVMEMGHQVYDGEWIG